MIKGQCLCGAVQYQYHGIIEQSIVCYCRDCQIAQGSVFAWNSPLEQQKFIITMGQEKLRAYFHTSQKARVFCSNCASPLYSYRLDLPHIIRLRLGTITEGDIPPPKEQFFQQYQPSFVVIQSN